MSMNGARRRHTKIATFFQYYMTVYNNKWMFDGKSNEHTYVSNVLVSFISLAIDLFCINVIHDQTFIYLFWI